MVLPEEASLKDRPQATRQKAGPILAISTNGTITKANLPARRALGQDASLEDQSLGSVLAKAMLRAGSYPDQLVLQLPTIEGQPHEIMLVLSDNDALPVSEPRQTPDAPVIPPDEAVNVADFIAHELRNRIAITLGLSQVLETNFENIEASERSSALRSIQVESEHALMVLEGLLRVVESRHRPAIDSAGIPVHSVLRRAVAEHKRRYPDRAFDISGDVPVFAMGDSTWMQIAIANLISNAEKVTPRDQSIQVSLRQEGNRIVILVMDHGKSMAPPVYQKLWDIYAKGAPVGVEISGSGIGLAVCKELVGSMGGRVWAGPRSQGGSAFAISLRGVPDIMTGELPADSSSQPASEV